MSIWDEDLSESTGWPDWFFAYRIAEDAAMEADFAALKSGQITSDEHGARAVRRADRRKQWIGSLPADRRAWLEAGDEDGFDDGTTFWVAASPAPDPRVDRNKARAAPDPVREYIRQHLRQQNLPRRRGR